MSLTSKLIMGNYVFNKLNIEGNLYCHVLNFFYKRINFFISSLRLVLYYSNDF